MSQTQVQLVGNVTTGGVFTGVVTTTSVNIGGGVVGINSTGINVSGIITATSFSGDGSGLSGAGISSTGSINTTGIVTASTIVANEFVGTGDKLIFSPTITEFIPSDGATNVSALNNVDIVLTYNQPVSIGTTGTITLRTGSASGSIIESYNIGVSTRATISNQTLTIRPTSKFDYNQEYYVVLPQGTVTNYIAGNSGILSTYNFTTEANPTLSSVSPGIGSTNIQWTTNIIFTFNKNIRAGVGTITLRTVSAGGTIIESYDVSSSNLLTFSSDTLTINPTNDLELLTNYYVVIPDGSIAGYSGINTYNFTTKGQPTTLGAAYEGGYAICMAGGTVWVVAPSTSEVQRVWTSRNDSNTRAQQVSGCTGWFVPSCGQLQNPGFVCVTYWDSHKINQQYWSNTEIDASNAWAIRFTNGTSTPSLKTASRYLRSFRCVTY